MSHRAPLLATAGVVVVAAILGGLLLVNSLFLDNPSRLEATATFEDVSDMADGAPVFMADVRIGEVSTIRLDPTETAATLTLTFSEDAGVPADVTARVRRTSPLGEKFVELRPNDPEDENPEMLQDGALIEETEVVPDFEQVVASGTDFFAALGASEIAVMLEEGARGFGGQGANIRAVLSNLETITEGFAANTDDITTLITAIDELSAATGPSAQAHADALSNLATTTGILDQESDNLLDLVDSLSALSREGSSFLAEHQDRVDRQLQALRTVTSAIVQEQQALANLLEFTPGHNQALILGVAGDFSQVMNSFITCGLPAGEGGEDESDPSADCQDGHQ